MTENFPCPFIYANGRKCRGHITGFRVYGPRRGDELLEVRKVRLWCSERDDHQGAVRSWAGRERMEFYPDRLPDYLRKPIFECLDSGLDSPFAETRLT
jgi:hypothetical protein